MSSIRSFIPLQKLGQGTYSNVYKVRRVDDNQIYALKKVKLNSLTIKQKQNALNEVRILASIESPNIVAYKQAFFDQSLNVLCVVMEYATDGDLQKVIKNHAKTFKLIEQQQIWRAAQHILKGLENLHSRGILHRDIKCANIFKTKGVYKLGDLNVSKVNGDKLAYTQTGTPYYASPQVWRDQPYDSKSDIWSFGCIIYEMAALKPPFNGKDMEDLFKNVQKGKIIPLTGHYSQDLWEFILLCLQKDPKKRPSATQLLKELKKHNSNATSGIKINNPENNKLLKTIKLPNDLKKLNQALPTSKYRKNGNTFQQHLKKQPLCQLKQQQHHKRQQKINQNKSLVVQSTSSLNIPSNLSPSQQQIDYVIQKKQSPSRYKLGQKSSSSKKISNSNVMKENKSTVHATLQSDKMLSPKNPMNNISQSSYRSPKSKIQSHKLFKSPISEVRLGKKVECSMGYSQRQQRSDRKPSTASKVQKCRYDINLSINDIAEQLKKPIPSMPRTQKKATLINNSHLTQIPHESVINKIYSGNVKNSKYNSAHTNITNQYSIVSSNQKYEVLDNWRNKLMKKNRILSSNIGKPSWW